MAEKKTPGKATSSGYNRKAEPEKRVPVYVERAGLNEERDQFVAVNGKNYLMPKGRTATVPESVAYELKRAERARLSQEARQAKLINNSAQ